MKKIILFFIVIVLFIPVVVYAQTATPTPAPSAASVTVIGDSLTTAPGAGRKLTESIADINLYSEIGRNWTQGLGMLTEVKNAGNLKEVLVFALGTNGGVSQANIESLITAAAGKNIILMTIYRENVDWLETTNQAINSAATNSNVKIADWYTLASAHPEWFGADGTHPSSSGYSALADLIIEAVEGSGPNLTGTPNEGRSNCVITKVGNPIGSPPPCPVGDLRQAILDEFQVTMNGFDESHLQWTREAFLAASDTNFPSLIAGATIEARCSDCGSQRVGCQEDDVSIYLGQYDTSAAYFKFILTHELGHFIHACNPRSVSGYTQHLNAIYLDGPISYYAGHAAQCTLSDNNSEDYADMIAYFLNPMSGHVSGPLDCEPDRNPLNPLFQLNPPKQEHLNVAQQIL
jgi:lysophospholipase L1-like esterase